MFVRALAGLREGFIGFGTGFPYIIGSSRGFETGFEGLELEAGETLGINPCDR